MKTPTQLLILSLLVPDVMANPLAEMDKICKVPDPFNGPAPKSSESPRVVSINDAVPDGFDWASLKFDTHCKVNDARVEGCDTALAASLRYVQDGKNLLKSLQEKVCLEKRIEADGCSSQIDSIKCVHGIYNSVAEEFRAVSEKLNERARLLKQVNAKLQQAAQNATKKNPSEIPAGIPLKMAREKAADEALTGVNPIRGRGNQTTACTRQIAGGRNSFSIANAPAPTKKFCSQITAASDTAFYSAQLAKAASETAVASLSFKKNAENIQATVDRGGSVDGSGNDEKKSGMLDGVGGFDGLMKMATLGMMGGGLYCSVSGQCSQQKETQNLAGDSSGIAATSPTPSSTNPQPASSPIGNTEKVASSNPSATNTDTKAIPPLGAESFSSTGSGFSKEKNSDKALTPFSGAIERAPASSGSLGGGASGAGASEGGGAPTEAVDASKKINPDSGGIGLGGGGGGLGHSGGFSLGDSGAPASSADSALKDILNGDSPALDSSLSSMLEGEIGNSTQASPGIDLLDAESLFLRVRETHVRCLKRGCIAHEVRENI